MERKNPNYIFDFMTGIFCGLLALGLTIAGLIIIVASFFTALPIFNGVVLLSLGVVIYLGIRIIYVNQEVITALANFVESLPNLLSGTSPQKNKPIAINNSDEFSTLINITQDTTPEEIEEIKKKFPMFADNLDSIIKTFKSPQWEKSFDLKEWHKKQTDLSRLSLEELNVALNNSLDKDEFEKAAEIRDEINKRKQK